MTEETSPLETLFQQGKLVRDETQRPFAEELIREFITQLEGHSDLASSDSPIAFINTVIAQLDEKIQNQLNFIMHHEAFQTLEGVLAWTELPRHEYRNGNSLKAEAAERNEERAPQ